MFVVSGEALMDVFDAGVTATGHALDARIGGSPLNVAIGLARLGQQAAFFGGVSTGFMGERLMAAMQQEGVDTAPVQRLAAPTTLGLVGLKADGSADYAFYADGTADRMLAAAAVDAVPQAQAFHFGSYTMVVEPVASTLRSLVQREHGRSLISYDPNVRLRVEPLLQRWREVLDWMLPRTHLLKVSEEDAALLYPDEPINALARRWLTAGAALVVVTRGSEGAEAWSPSVHVRVPPVPVTVVDTVGAGDTFQAALLATLAERGKLSPEAVHALDRTAIVDLLTVASRAAAITCSRRGADLPRRAEVF